MKYSNPGADFPCGVEILSAGSNPVLNARLNINNFQGYSLYHKVRISYLRYDRNRKTSFYRILIAQDVEYLRCNIFNEGWRVGINYL